MLSNTFKLESNIIITKLSLKVNIYLSKISIFLTLILLFILKIYKVIFISLYLHILKQLDRPLNNINLHFFKL